MDQPMPAPDHVETGQSVPTVPTATSESDTLPELIFDRLERMEFAFAEANDSIQDLTRALGDTIDRLSSAAFDAGRSQDAGLSARLHEISTALTRLEGLDPRLSATQTHLDALRAKIDFAIEAADGPEVMALADAIKYTAAHASTQNDLQSFEVRLGENFSEVNANLAWLDGALRASSEKMESLQEKVEKASDVAERLVAAHIVAQTDESQTAQLDAIPQKTADLLSAETAEKLANFRQQLGAHLEGLKPLISTTCDAVQKLADRDGPEQLGELFCQQNDAANEKIAQKLEKAFTDIEALITATGDRVQNLESGVEALQSRPEPVIDLGPQKRSFAQFGVALSGTLAKFEKVSEKLEEKINASPDEEQQDVAERLAETLDQKLEAFEARMTAKLENLMSQQAQKDDALALTPELFKDQSEEISKNFETALSQKFAALMSRRAAEEQDLLNSSLAEAMAEQRALSNALSDKLETLTTQVETLRARPDPILDMTPHRRAFAQFGLVASKLLARFETIAEKLENGDTSDDQIDVLKSLNEAVDRAPEKIGHLLVSKLRDDMGKWQADVASAFDQRDGVLDEATQQIGQLISQIEALRSRPDPTLDLGPQKRAFAQLGLVANALLARFETAAQQFENGALFSDLDERLTSLSHAIEKLDVSPQDVAADTTSLIDGATQKIGHVLSGKIKDEMQTWKAEVRSLLDPSESVFNETNQQLATLASQIEALRSRPDPTLDLGPQRRAFAQFSLALHKILDHIESTTLKGEASHAQNQAPDAVDGDTHIAPNEEPKSGNKALDDAPANAEPFGDEPLSLAYLAAFSDLATSNRILAARLQELDPGASGPNLNDTKLFIAEAMAQALMSDGSAA